MKKSEFELALSDAESELSLLKARYEQWIQGIERVPPYRQRDKLERELRALRREQPNNTAMRFKFQSVFARWTTLSTYWARVTRQIEEGTFRRDVMKVRQRREAIAESSTTDSSSDSSSDSSDSTGVDLTKSHEVLELDLSGDFDLDTEIGAALDALDAPKKPARPAPPRPEPAEESRAVFGRPRSSSMPHPPAPPRGASPPGARPPPPPPGARPPPPPPGARRTPSAAKPAPSNSSAGLSSKDVERVYERYVDARRRNNERVDNVSLDKLASRLRKMEPELRKKHGGKVDFEVVVKNGRVGLKPVPKKDG